jgi:aspartate aminotransferase-like enzyme
VHAWGLDLVAEHPSFYSDTVSAIRTPEDVDARDVLRIAYEEMNTSFGSGLARLQGKVFRIGHLGDFNEGMALTALSHRGDVAGPCRRANPAGRRRGGRAAALHGRGHGQSRTARGGGISRPASD